MLENRILIYTNKCRCNVRGVQVASLFILKMNFAKTFLSRFSSTSSLSLGAFKSVKHHLSSQSRGLTLRIEPSKLQSESSFIKHVKAVIDFAPIPRPGKNASKHTTTLYRLRNDVAFKVFLPHLTPLLFKSKHIHTNKNRILDPSLALINKGEITAGGTCPTVCFKDAQVFRSIQFHVCNNKKTGRKMFLRKSKKGRRFVSALRYLVGPMETTMIVICCDGSISKTSIDGLRKLFGWSREDAVMVLLKLTRIARSMK
jgi:hypothetical protein